jgi:5-methylcytosine-specific restriction enzyme A
MGDKDRRHDEQRRRDPEYQARRRIYNSSLWQHTRKHFLAAHPLCEQCKRDGKVRAAAHVDHMLPLAEGGAPYDWANLQALCAPCHSEKTAAEKVGKPAWASGACVHGYPTSAEHPWNQSGDGCPKCTGGVRELETGASADRHEPRELS